ncbi:MAG: recombination-associated protein RdgC [bacterium]
MGFISSSASFTRYRVKDQLPADYRQRYAEEIRRYAFREMEEESDLERSLGWVNIMNVMDNEFPGEEFFKGEFIALSLRIDTRRVPAQVLKNFCRKAEEEIKSEQGKDFLSKAQRQEIRDVVKLQLLKRAIPNTRSFDMIWDIVAGQLFFSSTNEGVCLEFLELYKKTFGLGLEQMFPYGLAQSILADGQQALLEQVLPVSFVPVSSGTGNQEGGL